MIFGSEMPDLYKDAHSKLTWPAMLATHLNLPYECYAWPGVGNLFIAERVLNQVNDPAFFVINWTYIDRFDYTITCKQEEMGNLRLKADSGCTEWDTLRPDHVERTAEDHPNRISNAKFYYKNLHSQYRDKLVTLMQIKSCIDILKEKQLSFLMTCQDSLIFETKWHTTPAIEELQRYIRPHIKFFLGSSSMDMYAKGRGCNFGPNGHPLEDGHRACFEYVLANFGVDKV